MYKFVKEWGACVSMSSPVAMPMLLGKSVLKIPFLQWLPYDCIYVHLLRGQFTVPVYYFTTATNGESKYNWEGHENISKENCRYDTFWKIFRAL